jgi:hypothetical protein
LRGRRGSTSEAITNFASPEVTCNFDISGKGAGQVHAVLRAAEFGKMIRASNVFRAQLYVLNASFRFHCFSFVHTHALPKLLLQSYHTLYSINCASVKIRPCLLTGYRSAKSWWQPTHLARQGKAQRLYARCLQQGTHPCRGPSLMASELRHIRLEECSVKHGEKDRCKLLPLRMEFPFLLVAAHAFHLSAVLFSRTL